MEPERRPYRGIIEDKKEELRIALDRASRGTFVFKARYHKESEYERLFEMGVLWKQSSLAPNQPISYGLTEEARKDLGIDEDENQRDNANWERATKPGTLPMFEYKIRSPPVFMSSESDRRDFLRNFIGHLGNNEFKKGEFEDFLGEEGYVKGLANDLLSKLYNVGIVEKREEVRGFRRSYYYRIPDDMKDLVAIV